MMPPVVIDHAVDWFKAITAECQGDEFLIAPAWQAVLAQSPVRLSVVRAARPTDVTLAQFAADRYPTYAEVYFWLGDALLEAGETAVAAVAYEQGLALEPADGLTWRVLGDLYRDQGEWQAAVQAYDEACFRVDQGKNGCIRAGKMYMEQGQFELAAARYRTSLQQLPNYTSSQRGLAEALLALGRSKEAIPYLQALAAKGDTKAQQQLQELK